MARREGNLPHCYSIIDASTFDRIVPPSTGEINYLNYYFPREKSIYCNQRIQFYCSLIMLSELFFSSTWTYKTEKARFVKEVRNTFCFPLLLEVTGN